MSAASRAVRVGVIALLVASRLPAQERVAREPREDLEAREEYFWAQRSFPSTVRPYAAMLQARLAAMQKFGVPRSLSGTSGLAGGWRSLGPAGFFGADNGYFSSGPQIDAGRVTGVAPSPNGGPLIISTASGGVWKSTFGIWSPLTDGQCALTTGAVTVDPADPNVIYVGTGEYNANSVGCGMLRSIDGGASWTQLGASTFRFTTGGSLSFARILVDRAVGATVGATTLLAATNAGVYRSTDGGVSWSSVLTGATASIVAHPTNAAIVYAGNSDNSVPTRRGIHRSSDRGATWTALPAIPSLDMTTAGRVELGVSAASPDVVFALIVNRTNSRMLGLFQWDDTKSQWTTLAAGGVYTGDGRGDFGAQGSYDLAIAVDPRDAKRVFVAGIRAYRSTDGGATFKPMAMEIHCDWHTIVFDPRNADIMYAGTDGGVFVSTDAGDSWSSRNAGLAITQYYPGIAVAPDGSKVMGGSQDNGTHIYSGSPVWNGFTGGDGGYTVINYANPSIIYGEAQWSTGGAYIIRKDASSSLFRTTGIVATDRGSFIPPLVMDPVTPTTLYFATHRLYRTTNEGQLWAPVSGDLSRGTGRITTVAVSKSDPQTIYAGTSDGLVQVTRNAGVTFTNVSAGLPVKAITRVVVDPADATHALVTVSGFGSGHVFETTDAGGAWRDISGTGLVDAPANAAVFIAGFGIMVGTDVGVYQTTDGGATWQAGPPGMPNVIIQDLVYASALKQVVAGTYGRGIFTHTLGPDAGVLRGDVNADGKVDAFDALLIQQAIVGSLSTGTVAFPRGDANCNGIIDAGDVLLVLRSAVGLATSNSCVNTVR
ncbi:MAG: dockerin type I domain-containing protein [Gemmatimonadaceae bacterium]